MNRHDWRPEAKDQFFGPEPDSADPLPPHTEGIETCRTALRESYQTSLAAVAGNQTTQPLAADLASAEIVDATPHARPMRVVLMGKTMAGKSTLLAALTGGSADRIGVGAQRTTRDIFAAPVLGLGDVEIVDTPGVGAKDGAQDVAIAMAELPAADLVLWVASNDSFQEETAQALREVALRGKPIIVVLNCRARLVDDLDREDFLADQEAVFAQHQGHFTTIRSHLAHAGVRPVVEVMLHAEAARQGRTDTELSDQLGAASRLETLLALLETEARERRVARRTLREADEVRSQAVELAEALSTVEVSVRGGAHVTRGLRVDQEQRAARLVSSCAQRMDDEIVRLVGLRRTWHQTITDFGPDVLQDWEREQAALATDLARALNSQLSQLVNAVDEANLAAEREWSTVPRRQPKVAGLRDFRGLWRRRVAGLVVGGGGALALGALGLAAGGPFVLGTAILGTLLIPRARKNVQSLFQSKAKILAANRDLLGSEIEKVLDELEKQTRAAAAGSITSIRDQLANASRRRDADETAELAVADLLADQREALGAAIADLDITTVRCLLEIDRRPRLATALTAATRLPGVCIAIQVTDRAMTEAWLFPPSAPETMTFGHTPPANLPGVMAISYVLGLTEEVPQMPACRHDETIVKTRRLGPDPVLTAWAAVLSDHLQTPVTILASTSPRSSPA